MQSYHNSIYVPQFNTKKHNSPCVIEQKLLNLQDMYKEY